MLGQKSRESDLRRADIISSPICFNLPATANPRGRVDLSIQEVIELIVNMHALAEYGPETTVEDLRWVGTMEGEHFRVKARARLASCSSITLTFMLGNVAELVDGELPSGR